MGHFSKNLSIYNNNNNNNSNNNNSNNNNNESTEVQANPRRNSHTAIVSII